MLNLALYLVMMLLGALIGSKVLSKEKEHSWIGKFQYVAIVILVVVMGARIGSDKKVFESIQEIGISASVVTVFVFIGSVLAVFLVRKLLGYDRKGERHHD